MDQPQYRTSVSLLSRRAAAALLAMAAWGAHAGAASTTSQDAAAIEMRMKQDFERPGNKLDVAPVVVVDTWALAGWTQGDMGGRALLRRQDGAWSIWLCAGDAIREAAALQEAGLPPPIAARLSADFASAESQEPASRIAQFSRFSGIVSMQPEPGARKE